MNILEIFRMFNIILGLLVTHITDYRYDHRKLMQNNGVRRPPSRGGRRGEHHFSVNHQRNQRGTRVFKNSPTNIQKGNIFLNLRYSLQTK